MKLPRRSLQQFRLQFREMTPDLDIYQAAKLLLDRYGKNAPERAQRRAAELWDAGDALWAALWRQNIQAIEELTRTLGGGKPLLSGKVALGCRGLRSQPLPSSMPDYGSSIE